MTENKNLNEPQKLDDDDLSQVNGGYFNDDGTGEWNAECEKDLQADFAAHGNGMSFDAFLSSKGLQEAEIVARNSWIRYGSRSDNTIVVSPRARGGWSVYNFVT